MIAAAPGPALRESFNAYVSHVFKDFSIYDDKAEDKKVRDAIMENKSEMEQFYAFLPVIRHYVGEERYDEYLSREREANESKPAAKKSRPGN